MMQIIMLRIFPVQKINGMGSIYDAAFVKGTNNANPDVIKDIKFDKTTGLAYIPKSYFEKNPNVFDHWTGHVWWFYQESDDRYRYYG